MEIRRVGRRDLVGGGNGGVFHLFHQGAQHLCLGDHPDLLTLAEYHRPAGASGNSHISVLSLSGAVDLAAHHGHGDLFLAFF